MWARPPLLLLLAASAAAAKGGLHTKAKGSNMNGKYRVASGALQDVAFNDDYASKGHEYFDVYGPEIATHYGEVFWTSSGELPIPEHVKKRFAGKAIAITGYEHDQVMVQPAGKPGLHPERDVSVPINWAYNHHYGWFIYGEHAELRRVAAEPGDPMAHGASTKWTVVELPSAKGRADPTLPTSTWFSEANGGESRKTFHGYPNGYAQVVGSPQRWSVVPMQIDTRNRACGATPADVGRCKKFTPGPEPRQARFGRPAPKETNYSGLLECPCGGRYGGDPVLYPGAGTKAFDHAYVAVDSGRCQAGHRVGGSAECFRAVAGLGINTTTFRNQTVANPKLPDGCSAVMRPDGSADAYFNTAGKAACSSGTKRVGRATSKVGVTVDVSLDGAGLFQRSAPGAYCGDAEEKALAVFPAPAGATAAAAYAARERCERHCAGDERCWGCTASCTSAPSVYGHLFKACEWTAVSACERTLRWAGMIDGDVSEKRPDGGVATITLSGPADVWFGVAVNATRMADQPYTILVTGAGVQENKLGTCGDEAQHCGGTPLARSVEVVSDAVEGGVRTVVMRRPLRGLTKDHYSFSLHEVQTLQCATAVGHSQTFEHHRAHGPARLTLTSVGEPTCVCDMGQSGALCDATSKGKKRSCNSFDAACVPRPQGDLVALQNPTCSSKTYLGGLHCCRHRESLLDADQEPPPDLLRYHVKFRVWFQEYRPATASARASHADLERKYVQTEAHAGEYDVPPAFVLPGERLPGYPGYPEGVPTPGTTCTGSCPGGQDCECEYAITYHFRYKDLAWLTAGANGAAGGRLIMAAGHCHAPACLSIELYRNDTGTPVLLCRNLPRPGQGRFPEDKWDEAGYLAIPPCLWSDDPDEGLQPTEWLTNDTPLFSVKRNRNTHQGHFGEMASWQMRAVSFPSDPPTFV